MHWEDSRSAGYKQYLHIIKLWIQPAVIHLAQDLLPLLKLQANNNNACDKQDCVYDTMIYVFTALWVFGCMCVSSFSIIDKVRAQEYSDRFYITVALFLLLQAPLC